MKLKAVKRTANVAWSPASHYPVCLAAGTAAQQLDATFSTTASLELYNMNFNDPGKEMELVGSIETDSRFYKLVWGSYGIGDQSAVSGLLMGGSEQGQLFVWDAAKIMANEDPLVHKFDKHSGPVATLDINPFQNNLIASGASESEIFIWDLTSPDKPMTPGTKAQPTHDVTCLAWNQQVQHILASSHGGNCIVWDLRKNEPIIKIRDSMSHIKCGVICWHPEVATQICVASEDDHTPVIQLWDLRSATSPLKVFENHQRGILSMSWCPSDPDLLMSSGKDNRILCWNPNSELKVGEVVYELPTGNQWSFDVQWCPRNPAVISSCSFDGHVTVHSVMGDASHSEMPPNMGDGQSSFDAFSQSVSQEGSGSAVLKKPPKWMRPTVGASFAFGGKLISFGNTKSPAGGQQQTRPNRPVFVSQVVTETDLVSRSVQLEKTLQEGQYVQFCDEKITSTDDLNESTIWSFLKVNFEPDARQQYLKLLGYTHSDIKEQVRETLSKDQQKDGDSDGTTVEKSADISSPFDNIVSAPTVSSTLSIDVNTDADGLITQALLTANFEGAVDVCLKEGRMAEALVLAIAGGSELLARTQKAFFDSNKSGVNRLMCAIVTQKFDSVIRTCDLNNWKEALAVILTYTAGEQFTSLCNMLGRRLETESDDELASNAPICYIVAGNIDQLVNSWSQSVSNASSHKSLQDLVEKVMILKNGVEVSTQGFSGSSSSCLAERLSRYAEVLASQGCIKTAMNYLNCASQEDPSVAMLVDRLSESLNMKSARKPYNTVNVAPQVVRVAPVVNPAVANPMTIHQNADPNVGINGYTNINQRLRPDANFNDSSRAGPSVPVPTAPSAPQGLSKKYRTVQAPEMPTSDYNNYQQQNFAPQSQPYMYPTSAPVYNTPAVPEPVANNTVYTTQPQQQLQPGRAWNDPPVVKDSVKQPYLDYSTGPSRYDGQFYNPAEYQPILPTPQEKFAQQQPKVEQVRGVAEQRAQPAAAVAAPPPLPEQHQVLQDVLNRLVQACSAQGAHNPQIKKKLEDVLRKLDYLYTQLVAGKLSQSTIEGLHRIVKAIQQYDYQSALGEHARIVSAGSFTEISQFMPGIKVLIQTALQLQVYI